MFYILKGGKYLRSEKTPRRANRRLKGCIKKRVKRRGMGKREEEWLKPKALTN